MPSPSFLPSVFLDLSILLVYLPVFLLILSLHFFLLCLCFLSRFYFSARGSASHPVCAAVPPTPPPPFIPPLFTGVFLGQTRGGRLEVWGDVSLHLFKPSNCFIEPHTHHQMQLLFPAQQVLLEMNSSLKSWGTLSSSRFYAPVLSTHQPAQFRLSVCVYACVCSCT